MFLWMVHEKLQLLPYYFFSCKFELVEIPNMYKNVNIEKKAKRGRKSKAGPWFEKIAHN